MKIISPLLIAAVTLPFIAAKAQKLPNIQENSVRASPIVKVDARLNDWGDNLQAYNKALGINYTLANDDKNLYLVIKANSQAIKNKIIGGGINLTINIEGKKTEKESYIISFPLIDEKNRRSQTSIMGKPMDSAALVTARKQVVKTFKEIKLTGFKDISENVISIYNEFGIKAAADFDDKSNLVCELAIPLKYFGENVTNTGFAYNLKLNGIDFGAGMTFSGPITLEPGSVARIIAQPQELASPTDIWGKYTLAKK